MVNITVIFILHYSYMELELARKFGITTMYCENYIIPIWNWSTEMFLHFDIITSLHYSYMELELDFFL